MGKDNRSARIEIIRKTQFSTPSLRKGPLQALLKVPKDKSKTDHKRINKLGADMSALKDPNSSQISTANTGSNAMK